MRLVCYWLIMLGTAFVVAGLLPVADIDIDLTWPAPDAVSRLTIGIVLLAIAGIAWLVAKIKRIAEG